MPAIRVLEDKKNRVCQSESNNKCMFVILQPPSTLVSLVSNRWCYFCFNEQQREQKQHTGQSHSFAGFFFMFLLYRRSLGFLAVAAGKVNAI